MMITLEKQIRAIADEAEHQLDASAPDAAAPAAASPGVGRRRSTRWLGVAAAAVLTSTLGAGLWALSQRSTVPERAAERPVTPTTLADASPPVTPTTVVDAERPVTPTTVVVDPDVATTLPDVDAPVANPGVDVTTTMLEPISTLMPDPIPENAPTRPADPDEMWAVATDLPDGYEYEVATSFGSVPASVAGTVRYVGDDGESIEVGSDSIFSGVDGAEPGEGTPVEIDGVEWRLRRTAEPLGYATLALPATGADLERFEAANAPDDWVVAVRVVRASGLTDEQMIAIATGLDTVAATELPRPPLSFDSGGAVVVAEATQDGVPKQLRVHTDGRFFTSFVGGGGGPATLGDEWVVVDGATGPNPNLVAREGRAESLVHGLLHPDVATVEVELTDGERIVTEPQDLHGFEENFFLVAIPTETEEGLERFAAVIVRDVEGRVLARDTSFG